MSKSIDQLRSGQANDAGFPAMLKKHQAEISRALPKHMSGDRLARIALTEFRKNPALGKCDPKSVFAAVVMGSQLGLEPGVLGQSYLVPYGSECNLIPGWRGLVDLVSRSGRASVWTEAVFDGDEFDWGKGDRPYITHKPCGESDPAKILYAYAVGRVNGCEWPVIEVWSNERIQRHRDRFNKVGKRHYSFQNWEMYARKVVLLQVIKYMPSSVELATAVDLDNAAQVGGQHLNTNETIAGEWAYVQDADSADNSGGVTYADITQQINKAETLDDLYMAESLISGLPNEIHRSELKKLVETKRGQFAK